MPDESSPSADQPLPKVPTTSPASSTLLGRFIAGNALFLASVELFRFSAVVTAVHTLLAAQWQVGLVQAASYAGVLVLGLIAGAVVERRNQRHIMQVVAACRAIGYAAITMATASGVLDVWLLAAALLVMSCADAFYGPAHFSIVPALVGRHRVSQAMSWVTTSEQAIRIIMPAAAGALLGSTAGWVAFAVALVAALASVACFTLVPLHHSESRIAVSAEPQSLRRQVVDGLRFITSSKALLGLVATVGLMNTAGGVLFTFLPIVAMRDLGLTHSTFGLAMGLGATGGIVGGLVSNAVARWVGRPSTMIMAMACLPAAFLILLSPLHTPMPPAVAVFLAEFVVSSMVLMFAVQYAGVVVELTPSDLLARTSSFREIIAVGTFPLAAAISGVVGSVVGSTIMVLIGAVIAVSPALMVLTISPALRRPTRPSLLDTD